MAGIVPYNGQVRMFAAITTFYTLRLRLYSNNHVPAITDTLSDYTEVSGGGYGPKDLSFDHWDFSGGSPGVGLYDEFVNFEFNNLTVAPGTVYGYYITVNNSGTPLTLLCAERFPDEDIPFTPVNGALIRIKPRITLGNAD